MVDIRDLPVLSNVALRNFSLYRNQRRVSVDIKRGVFCLAGANGLGKSSFLAAVNFGLTGIVANPARSFQGVDDYYTASLVYSHQFFDGRIDEDDRELAQVRLTFMVGEHRYVIARNLFKPQELEELAVYNGSATHIDGSDRSPSERHTLYAQSMVADCRVGSFPYFVFLQHFILTFDERRHLLFWNNRSANAALYLAFGLEPHDMVRSDQLRLAISAADSNARNAQWQATLARRRLNELGTDELPGLEELRQRHDVLVAKAEAASEAADNATQAIADARLAVAEASSRQHLLRSKYDEEFASRITAQHSPRKHPTVARILAEDFCEVCGTRGPDVSAAVRRSLSDNECPLCQSEIAATKGTPDFRQLERLDASLSEAKAVTASAQARLQRVEAEAQSLAAEAAAAADALAKFEESNSDAMVRVTALAADTDVVHRRAMEEEHRGATARRDEFRRKRDDLRNELTPIQSRLTMAYQTGELEFVPRFRRLAKRFIGLDLDVHLEQDKDAFRLSLEVQGSRRRTTTSLSESQRFFIEIALRMTLMQHMACHESPGALLIDTPEGSLDISYEARAGDMFADFVKDGSNIIMTANINSSELLLRLAERCGSANMRLLRMTEWTPLSEVQAEEEALFERAYSAVERALGDSETTQFQEVG